jgi:hypothetical protein
LYTYIATTISCAMKKFDSGFKAFLIATVLGVAIWLPLNAINQAIGKPPNDAWSLWYWVGYPLILLSTAILGYWSQNKIWLIGPIAVFASYIAALFLVSQTGNMLPFELLWMAILSAPAAWAGKVGADFRKSGSD